ncbi:hypothetical protein AOLI_G00130670 [Acnodon oligacanthus]
MERRAQIRNCSLAIYWKGSILDFRVGLTVINSPCQKPKCRRQNDDGFAESTRTFFNVLQCTIARVDTTGSARVDIIGIISGMSELGCDHENIFCASPKATDAHRYKSLCKNLNIPQRDSESSGLLPSDSNSGVQVPEIECPLPAEEFAGLKSTIEIDQFLILVHILYHHDRICN